jgi:hypothetical protein
LAPSATGLRNHLHPRFGTRLSNESIAKESSEPAPAEPDGWPTKRALAQQSSQISAIALRVDL